MQEQDQLARLVTMRRIATGLLLSMAVVFLAAHLLQPMHAWLAYVRAFSEAALVGALADWFAVTALFRRPLGLPIPHTAIIPNNKDRIGESIGNFLEHNFMTRDVLREELLQIDFAGSAAHWLAQPANSGAIARQVVGTVPLLLRMVEDEEASQFLRKALSGSLSGIKLAPLLAQVLTVLAAGRQHHLMLERMLGIVARALEQNRPYIRQKVHQGSPRWMPRAIDEKVFERLMEGVESILAEIQAEDSEWRARFQAATDELIGKLATSPEYERKLQGLLAQGLGHPLFRGYVGDVWRELKQRLLDDTGSPRSQLEAHLEHALRLFSKALDEDAAVQQRLNGWLRDFLAETIVARRHVIAALVQRVIRKWDAETVSRKFELHVGRDLQYIRINGTLVGGLVGLVLHGATHAL